MHHNMSVKWSWRQKNNHFHFVCCKGFTITERTTRIRRVVITASRRQFYCYKVDQINKECALHGCIPPCSGHTLSSRTCSLSCQSWGHLGPIWLCTFHRKTPQSVQVITHMTIMHVTICALHVTTVWPARRHYIWLACDMPCHKQYDMQCNEWHN